MENILNGIGVILMHVYVDNVTIVNDDLTGKQKQFLSPG